ncbi:hypothetical protein BJY04DRAFT_5797 [Aspergillus karnatakaensis]|uniref:uncharacterized protein n=1 Tax=Aspergillus karnatakaensis TaxID=1810916 RepID=UPI003CCDA528
MRHHVQEKRRQQRHPHSRNGSERKGNGLVFPYTPWEHKEGESPERADSRPLSSPSLGGTPILSSPDSRETKVSGLKPVVPESPPHTPSPLTLLGASRKDPFDSLPVTRTADMELADYWTNKLTYWSGQNNYIKDCAFKTAMAHPLAFEAVILSYCARWKAQLYPQQDSTEVDYHLSNVTKGIEDATNGRLKIDSDSLAMALAGLALQEDRFGSKEKARIYEDRAIQILRTGPRSSGQAEIFLHYIRYVMMPLPVPNPASWEDGHHWLVTFLRAAEGLMVSHNTEQYLATSPERRTAFQMESPLFSLLSSGPRPSRVPEDSRIYVVRNVPTQEITRTAALIYITAALWDYQDSPSKTVRFLIYLQNLVKKHQLDRFPACESFIWHLLEEKCDMDLRDPERAWSTCELLKIHKHLPPNLQFQYNETLFSYLMLAKPLRGVDAFEKELALSSGSRVEEV